MAGLGKSLVEFMQLQLVEAPAASIHMYSPLLPATPLRKGQAFELAPPGSVSVPYLEVP